MTEAILFLLFLLAVVGVFFLRLVKRKGRHMKVLLDRGRVAQGVVTAITRERQARGRYEYFMTYSFDSVGTAYSKKRRVSPATFAEGDRIELVYDPNEPDINMPKDMVDKARKLMSGSGSR